MASPVPRLVWTLLCLSAIAAPAAQAQQPRERWPLPRAQEPAQPSELIQNREAQIFLRVAEAIRRYALKELSDSALWELAIQALVDELGDPYATVFTADQYGAFEENTTGNYAGIGVQITQLSNVITITAVFRGTPADSAGLQVGDRIVAVEGESTAGWSTADAARRIRGRRGTTVSLLIQREGIAEPLPHTIRRDEVHVPAVTTALVADSIGYIRLDRVARGAVAEVDSALDQLRGMRGLILDLRRNPGGYLDEGIATADLFLPRDAPIASIRGRRPEDQNVLRARRPPRVPNLPLVVLVDGYTASAAEIIAGALQDHDRALLIGERTFGKGLVQTLLPLPQGRWLRLTTGSWYTPLGRSLDRPRDREGRLLPEPEDSAAVVTTSGRTLSAGGGILPDVIVHGDTLRTAERELWNAAATARVPLNVRIAEFVFGQARRADPPPATIPRDAFEEFVDHLVAQGIPAEKVRNPIARRYLRWQVDMQYADRTGRLGRSLELQAERDLALAEALRRLGTARTQAELFARSAANTEARRDR